MKTIHTHHHSSSYSCSCQGKKLSYKSLLTAVLSAFAISAIIVYWQYTPVKAQESTPTCMTQQEVDAALDEGNCYVTFGNKVYDFNTAKKWDITGHVGQHLCGKDYDAATIEAGPHPASVVDKFYLADLCSEEGVYDPSTGESQTPVIPENAGAVPTTYNLQPTTFNIFGMSIRFFFAYVSLFAFLLNFATCYAMPWAKHQAPWLGDSPLPDDKDSIGRFPFTHWHAYFAWLAIFALSVHGFLAFACSWWGFCY